MKFVFTHVQRTGGTSAITGLFKIFLGTEITGDIDAFKRNEYKMLHHHNRFHDVMYIPDCCHMTILRHPVDIMQSWLSFNYDHFEGDKTSSMLVKIQCRTWERSKEEYFDTFINDNFLVDRFAFNAVKPLKSAMMAIVSFDFVGLFPSSTNLCNYVAGKIGKPVIDEEIHVNNSHGKIVFTQEERDMIEERIPNDMEIWNYVKSRIS